MPEPDRMLGMFLHLSRASRVRQQPMVRDKLLVLAGVQAQEMGLLQISALCRHKILAHNPQHLLGQWPTIASALADEPFQSYLKQLRRRYSPEKTEHILHSLGIELGRERDAYFSDLEYAAALLDTRPEEIAGILAAGPPKPPVEPDATTVADHRKGTLNDRTRPGVIGESRASWPMRNLWVVWAPLVVLALGLIGLAMMRR
jgi:hypothetical protein